MTEKTHWLRSPNKNYLGHPDLPNGADVILTIKTAKWEDVKSPVNNKQSDLKRVIRFEEEYKWLKPFICNQTNAQTILNTTKQNFMEDCSGKKIKIAISQTRVKGQEVDCLRVKKDTHESLSSRYITEKEIESIRIKLSKQDEKTEDDICKAMKVDVLNELKVNKLNIILNRLDEIINEDS